MTDIIFIVKSSQMDDCVFAVVLMHSSLVMFKRNHFVRGSCDKSLRLAVMFGVNTGQCDLSALSAVVMVFGD